jgi:putative cardiolipin synthase
VPGHLRRIAACLLVGALAGCMALPERPALPEVAALPAGSDSPLDRLVAAEEARRPGQSGFRLVVEGQEAFVLRAHSARTAQRSLDVQTYIWHADLTGLALAHEIVAAADRGVRVRLLIDDMDARAKNAGLAALDAHPNIEVRLFNPYATRWGKLRQLNESLLDFRRINRRMHNKTWIADNRLAIAGGRNIGDEYYTASGGVNFVDLDFAMVGPVVREASASFDKYWNAAQAYPMALLDPEAGTADGLAHARAVLETHAREAAASRYAEALRSGDAMRRLVSGDWPLEWASNFRFVSDDPGKIDSREEDAGRSRVVQALLPMAQSARTSLAIISPYFVPGEATAHMVAAAGRGVQVRVLTNSLVASDVPAVHGGYARYRKALLEGGVQIWELKPADGAKKAEASLFGSSGASLHTKAIATDSYRLFVGSYNLDPRSTYLNCEQGVLVENPVLAQQLEGLFTAQTAGERSWRVRSEDGALAWSDGREAFDNDPHASAWRRFQAWLVRLLGLEAQL